MRLAIALATVFLLSNCKTAPSVEKVADLQKAPERAPAESRVPTKTLFLSQLDSAQQFEDLAEASTGIVRQGVTIKLLIDNRESKTPVVYFMNANYCPQAKCEQQPLEAVSHYRFARAALSKFAMTEGEYVRNAYYTTSLKDRKFFDARIQRFTMKVEGAEREFYGIRFIERDAISEEMLQFAVRTIREKLKIPSQNLAVITNSLTQKTDTIAEWLKSRKISVFSMQQILDGIDFIGLNPGEAYGFLRVFPQHEEDLEPFDIPVFSSLPLDLSVVAGTISTEYQDVGSHVNLKSKERGTPNMVVRETSQVAKLKSLDGKPVKLAVTYAGYTIEEVSSDTVWAEYKKKTSGPWTAVGQLDTDKMIRFDEMCKDREPAKCLAVSRSYGGKVAGLGFLAHPKVAGNGSALAKRFGYRLAPYGVGAPLSFYNRFMQQNLAKNAALADAYKKLIAGEMGLEGAVPLQLAERKALIDTIKAEILKGDIPQGDYEKMHAEMLQLKKQIEAAYKMTEFDKLKIRSSSNAEDIEGFNGAGLHDSYSARISKTTADGFSGEKSGCRMEVDEDDDTGLNEEDVKPKSLACAVKATYASLWNLRAVRERSYKRFDHRTAAMGLSIQAAYKFRKKVKIKANSVLVTRVLGTTSVFGQQMSTQVKNGLVTNPVPDTKAELAVISFDNSGGNVGINLLQFAKPEAGKPALTSMILSRAEMLRVSEIAREVEIVYCDAKPGYYPDDKCKFVTNSQKKKLALDMEFKFYDNGEILIKQVRTFSGR